MKNFIGIDISQKDFWTAQRSTDGQEFSQRKVLNTPEAITEFVSTLGPADHCILEATGNYSLTLTYRLTEAGIAVSVINPSKARAFRELLRLTWKDDPADARMLCLYGEHFKPEIFKPASREILALKQKRALLRQLKQKKVCFRNFLHSLQAHPFKDAFTQQKAQEMIQLLDEQIKLTPNEIALLVKKDFQPQLQYLTSIKGIGHTTAWAFIEATQGFTAFQSPKQFAKFIGVVPTFAASGTSVRKKSTIYRSGDAQMRSLLYMCTWTAYRYNKPCQQLYQRLTLRGKPHKVALMAVVNKLIRQAFAVVNNQTLFDMDFEEETTKPSSQN